MYDRIKPRFKIGDEVIVSRPEECKIGVNKIMLRLAGVSRRITEVRWSPSRKLYVYSIEDDDGDWSWTEECFDPIVQDLAMFEPAAVDDLFSMFS